LCRFFHLNDSLVGYSDAEIIFSSPKINPDPVLQKARLTYGKKPEKHYYAPPVKIYDEYYFLCHEWFETSANNDRPYLIKWLEPYL
jgi:hypothetical protein